MSKKKPTWLSDNANDLIARLGDIAQKGFVLAIGHGDTTVGMTLLSELGIKYDSKQKPKFNGIVVTARRVSSKKESTRLNLFTKVADWGLSDCKSSREIAEKYGYVREEGEKKLYCTVSSKSPNAQGLLLDVDRSSRLLIEYHKEGNKRKNVATWRLDELERCLENARPESVWVGATSQKRSGVEEFHYREAVYTGPPETKMLATLLEEGTITLDHLIQVTETAAREKGPSFKIKPNNMEMLFPKPRKINLLDL